jgi:hypothetical protein
MDGGAVIYSLEDLKRSAEPLRKFWKPRGDDFCVMGFDMEIYAIAMMGPGHPTVAEIRSEAPELECVLERYGEDDGFLETRWREIGREPMRLCRHCGTALARELPPGSWRCSTCSDACPCCAGQFTKDATHGS